MSDEEYWSKVIDSESRFGSIGLRKVFQNRELIYRFIYRDFVTLYKQTILGPTWYFLQPIIMMLAYILVFNNIAKIPTDGLPPSLFYLSGIILWNYFSESFTQTADTFNENQHIFGKVFFPRLIIPIAKISSGLLKFTIQFFLFLCFYFYFLSKNVDIHYSYYIFIFPSIVVITGLTGFGLGLVFTSLTIRYRDLKFLLQFGIQILMFCTPIIYPMSVVNAQGESIIGNIMFFNPLSHLIESFKYLFLGQGNISFYGLLYSFSFTIIICLVGILIFNRSEKTFIDSI